VNLPDEPFCFVGEPQQPKETTLFSGTQKAVAAFVLSFLAALLAQVADKTEFTDLTVLQWVIAVVSAVVTAGGVYAIPNQERILGKA
jgi:hypothetical protein